MPNTSAPLWLRVILPLVIVFVWLGIAGVGGPYFGKIDEVSEVDLTAFLPRSAEATQVNSELKKFQDTGRLAAVVVFESKKGKLTTEQFGEIATTVEGFKGVEGVVNTQLTPVVSKDNKAYLTVVQIDSKDGLEGPVSTIRKQLKRENIDGVSAHVTGPAGFAADLNVAFSGIDGILLLTALAVVFIILLLVYRSALLPIIVLLTSIFALSASILIVFTLAKLEVIQLNGQVQGILFILVIGAATDYSLLYVSRYREALYAHAHRLNATKDAFRGALEPIAASAGTVIVGLLCLLLSDLESNKALGPVGAIGIAMALVSALTFLPAALMLAGRKAFWPVIPRATAASRAKHTRKLERGVWHRVGQLITKRPRLLWSATLAILLLAALAAPQIKASGVPQSDLVVGYSEAREGQKVISRHFPAGSGSPALVIAGKDDLDEVIKASDRVEGVERVAVVTKSPGFDTIPVGDFKKDIEASVRRIARIKISRDPETSALPSEAQAAAIDAFAEKAYPFKDAVPYENDGRYLLQVTLKDDVNSDAAKKTIKDLRSSYARNGDASKMDARVGGITAAQLDANTASIRDRAVIIPAVLVAITIILALLLRSILAPLLLLATTVLSFASSIGVAALLFNNVWHFPGADPSVLLYAFVFLVALGIDYNIFLMTRVREESLKSGTAKGVIKGTVVTGSVITSAGVVLAATFAALSVIPILFLFQLAFIVAFGVLLDTVIVRSLLVPSLIRDIGSVIWWPSKVKK